MVLATVLVSSLSACMLGRGNYSGTDYSANTNPSYQNAVNSVTGVIVSNNLSSLPTGTKVVVSILDITDPSTPAKELARQVITNTTALPMSFKVDYNPANVLPANQYNLVVRAEKNNIITYWNDSYAGVLTRGTGNNFNRVVSVVPTGYRCDECKFTD